MGYRIEVEPSLRPTSFEIRPFESKGPGKGIVHFDAFFLRGASILDDLFHAKHVRNYKSEEFDFSNRLRRFKFESIVESMEECGTVNYRDIMKGQGDKMKKIREEQSNEHKR